MISDFGLKLRQPLPPANAWSIDEPTAEKLVELIRAYRPRTVFECGSGISTLVMAYALEETGPGFVYALEHDIAFVNQLRRQILDHRLFNVRVMYRPIASVWTPFEDYGREMAWYGIKADAECLRPIEMLFVDGPPGHVAPLARYPAIPILRPYLSPTAVVVCDDTSRGPERLMVQKWAEMYDDFSVEEVRTDRGLTVMRRQAVAVEA